MKIKKTAQSAGIIGNVVDNLNSTSAIDALSANQGRELKTDLTTLENQAVIDMRRPETENIDEINKTEFRYTSDIERTPTGGNGYLFTQIMNENYLIQKFTEYNGVAEYWRTKTDGSWGRWSIRTRVTQYSEITEPGWYRVATIGNTGHPATNLILNISTSYQYNEPNSIALDIITAWKTAAIKVLNYATGLNSPIKRARVQYNEEIGKFYVDVYYGLSVQNGLYVVSETVPSGIVEILYPVLVDTEYATVSETELPVEQEGTWTPEFSTVEGVKPTVEYLNRYGYYKKEGNLVYINFYIKARITALNGTNNYAIVQGLPFTCDSFFAQNALSIGVLYEIVSRDYGEYFTLVPTANHIRIQGNYGASATPWIITNNASGYCEIGGSGWYTREMI